MPLTLSHNFVDLTVLLTTDEFFVLIRKLYLHTHLIRCSLDEWYLIDDHHRRLDSVIGPVDGKGELFEAEVSARVRTDVAKHDSDVFGRRCSNRRTLRRIGSHYPPRSTVELTSLYMSVKNDRVVDNLLVP